MRTATVTKFGGPEVFELVTGPDPVPGPGEVVIAVAVADVLWLETMIRSGAGQGYWPSRPPYVPGNGVAGTVAATGAGVDPGLAGRRVVAHTGNEGGYADRTVVAADAISFIPDELDVREAAALLHDGPTALALFDVTKAGPRDAVLIVGASGGLGLVSLQLARARCERVVALARTPKLGRVARLAPDAVIDSTAPDWLDQARAALPAAGADVVLDNVGGDLGEASFALTAPGGRFSAHGTPAGRFARIARDGDRTVTGIESVQMTPDVLKRYTEQALAQAAAGVITPVIGQVFPLENAADAHAAIEARTALAKTVLLTA
jgi:NADPH:quinone reductase